MAECGLRSSTHQQLQNTLKQLDSVWDDLGLTEDQREDRTKLFYGHVMDLCEKILVDERALKTRIINQIERNTIDILKLSEELNLDAEESVDGLTLIELDAVLQERKKKLQETKTERLEELRNLQEKDEGLCELLCETPYYIPSGMVPSTQDLEAVKEHIKNMEEEKDEREATFRKLKAGLLHLLEQLERAPQDPFTREVVCSDDEEIPLGQATIQQLRAVHSDLEFEVRENTAKSLELRERITGLWALLEVSQEDQQAFLATAPSHTPSCMTKLEEELERLKCMRLQNLSVFVDRLHRDLEAWWDKCFVGQEERDNVNSMCSGEVGEDVLACLENEVEKWRKYHTQNSDLLGAVEQFHSLFRHMLELEERAKDPSRLFNTRGGVLLQEEKAKKKVKNELPRVQEQLEKYAQLWEEREGRPFLVYGKEVLAYLDHLWSSHKMKRESEKAKRIQAKEGKKCPGGPTQARTPVPPCTRKRGMEMEEAPHNTKKHKNLPTPCSKSPAKAPQRSPSKTPRGKPLSEYNRLPVPAVNVPDASLQSITYDKFKDTLQKNELLNSTALEQDPSMIRKALF